MARMLDVVVAGRLPLRLVACVGLMIALVAAGSSSAMGEPGYPPPVQGDTYRVLKTIRVDNGVPGSAYVQDFEFDLDGNLWVIEDGSGVLPRLIKYDTFGLVAATYTNLGLRQPTALAFGPDGMLYITDANEAYTRWYGEWGSLAADGRVVVVNPSTGAYVGQKPDFAQPGPATLSTIDEAPLNLRYPSDIEFDSAGNVYICDFAYNRISVFSPGWEPVRQFGNVVPEYGDGRFMHPWGIDLAPDGALWVADFYNDRVHRMSTDGTFLSTYGPDFPGWVPTEEELLMGASASIMSPLDVVVDEYDIAYVVDAQTYWHTWGTGRFFRVSAAGEFLGYYGATRGEESVGFPSRIHVDHDGAAWVNDEGFTGTSPAIHKFGLNAADPDLVPPVTTSSYNGEWTNAGPLSVTLSAVDASTTVAATFYSLDGSDPTVRYEGPISVSEEGTTTLKFRSVDRVGNLEDIQTQLLRIDHVAPTTWSSVVTTYYGSAFISFEASDTMSGPLQTYWRLDDAPPQPGTLAPVLFNPGKQLRKIEYYSFDRAGNREPSTTVFFWVLPTDDNPPETSWVERTDGWFTADTQVTLSAVDDVSGVDATYLQLDGSEWTTYTAPIPVTQEGTHTLSYYSVDTLGKRETTRTGTIRIDKTKPSTTATWTIGSIGSATIDFSPSDAVSGVQRLDWRITTGPQGTVMADWAHTTTALLPTHGNYTVAYRAYDWAGNFEDVKYVYVTVIAPDHEPPVTISSIPLAGWIRGPHELVLTASDGGGSGVRDTLLSVDDGPWIDYQPGEHIFPQGVYEVRWYSVDTQNNAEQIKYQTLRVDETPPTATTNAQPFYAGRATVGLNASDAQSGAVPWFRLDGGPAQAGFSVNLNDYRTFTLEYWAVNGAGLESSRTTIQIQVNPPDTVAPVSTFFGPADWQKGFATFSLNAVDEHSSVQRIDYTINGSNPIFYTGPVNISAEGTTTIGYFATDIYNNREATRTATLRVDASPPVTGSDAVSTYTDQAHINLLPTDALSGVTQTYFRVNGGAWQSGTDITVNWSRWRRYHTIDYYSVDAVGNNEALKSATFEIRLNPVPYQPTDSRLVYRGSWAPAFSNDVVATDSSGSYVYVAFQGTRLDLSARKGPDMGIMRASVLDTGLAPVMVDLYSPSNVNGGYSPPAWTTGDLEYGDYVVKLEWTGLTNSPGGGALVNIDELRVEGVLTQVVDQVAPVTTHTAPSGWVRGPAVVELSSTDATTGVKGVYVTSDGTTPTVSNVYTGPLTITQQGITTVKYFASDNRGNVEDVKSVTVRVDDQAPVTNTNAAPSYISTSTINLYPNDLPNQGTSDNSGIAYTRWRLDGGAWTTGTAVPVAGSALGSHTLEWFSVDRLGNTEATKSATFTVLKRFDSTDSRLYLRGTWSTVDHASLLGGSHRRASTTDSAAHFTFKGTGFDLIAIKSTSYGIARITVDDAEPVLVDQFAPAPPAPLWQQRLYGVRGLSDGIHRVRVEYTGSKNPSSTGTSIAIDGIDVVGELLPDTTAPASSASSPSTWVRDSASVSLAATDSDTWVSATRYAVNGSVVQTYAAPITVSTDGTTTITYFSIDGAGNVEATKSVDVLVDKSAPIVTSDAPWGWVNSPVTVALTSTDSGSGVARVLYSVDGGEPDLTYEDGIVVSEDGTTTVRFRAVDLVGNESGIQSIEVRIDSTAPSAADDAPAVWSGSPVNVTLSALDEVSGVERIAYRVDGGEESTYSAPVSIVGEGITSIEYRAIDVAGNHGAWRSATVRVDDTAPESTDDAPIGWVGGPVIVTLSSADALSGVGALLYSIDGTDPSLPYTGPIVVAAQGTTTIRYAAMDTKGNVEQTRSTEVQIDDHAPALSDDAPQGWVNGPVDVKLAAADQHSGVAGIGYSLDGGPEATYREPITVSGDGTHTIEYSAIDLAGNRETATATVAIDNTAPVTVSNAVSSYTGTATIMLSPSDQHSGVAVTEYRLNGGAWTTGTGLTVVTGGTHAFEWRSIDAAGNVEDTRSASFTVFKRVEELDSTLSWSGSWTPSLDPRLSGGAHTRANTVGSYVFLTFRGTGLDWIAIKSSSYGIAKVTLDGGPPEYVDLYSPSAQFQAVAWSKRGLPDATHTLRIECTGMKSVPTGGTSIAIDAFAILGGPERDTIPPATTGGAASTWRSAPVTVTLTASDNLSPIGVTRYRVNGGTPTTYTAPFTVSAEGTSVVEYYSVDIAGNVEDTKSLSVRIDYTAPAVSDDAPAPWVNGPREISLAANDAGSGVEQILYSTDGSQPSQPYSGPLAVSAEGTTTIRYVARDAVGNTSSLRTASVRIDTTAPSLSAAVPPDWARGPYSLPVSAGDTGSGVARILYSLDDTTPSILATSVVVVDSEGSNRVRLTAVDEVGNRSAETVRLVRVDNTPPSTSTNALASYTESASISFSANDSLSGIARTEYSLNDSAWIAAGSVHVPNAGNHVLRVRSVDVAGNVETSKTTTFTITGTTQETDALIGYLGSWATVNDSRLSGGSHSRSSNSTAAVRFTFKGTDLTWIAIKSSSYGVARVSVDGGPSTTVDLYSASPQWKSRVWSVSGLTDTTHTVLIEATGTKNPASSGFALSVDALEAVGGLVDPPSMRYEDSSALLGYTTGWTNVTDANLSAGSHRRVSGADEGVNINFEGTSIDWIALKSVGYGIAKVTLNGGTPEYVDLYSASPAWRTKVWGKSGLPNRSHNLRIEWTGSKNTSATGTLIGVDAIDVRGVLTAAPPLTPPMVRFEQSDSRIAVIGGWHNAEFPSLSGSSHIKADTGATANIAFRGTAVDLIALKSAGYGIAKISLDGGAPEYVDLYSPVAMWKSKVWSRKGLTDTTHTITVEWTGTKNAAATASAVAIDAVDTNGVLVQAVTPPAPMVRHEQSAPQLWFSAGWDTIDWPSLSGGTHLRTDKSGGAASVQFVGRAIDLIVTKSSGYGIAKVTLDGGTPVLIDLYSASSAYKQRAWSVSGLADTTHTVTIEWTGTKNASSTGTMISVDAIDIDGRLITATPLGPQAVRHEETATALAYAGSWSSTPHSLLSGGAHLKSNRPGDEVVVRFTGTSVVWTALKSAGYGIAEVTLDDGTPTIVNLYSPTALWKSAVYTASDLAQGQHTLRIRVTGDKSAAASDCAISIDAIDIVGTLDSN